VYWSKGGCDCTPSLLAPFHRCAGLSIRSVISVCIGSEQYLIVHSRKQRLPYLCDFTWRWVWLVLWCTPSDWYRSCQHANGFPNFRVDL